MYKLVELAGKVMRSLQNSAILLIKYEAEFTVTDRTCSWEWGLGGSWTQGDWPSHLLVQSLTSIVGTDPLHCQSSQEEGQRDGGGSCTSTALPSGVEFLSTSIIHEPSQITLVGRMDEVYFCIVLHKEEDRRHFLLSVLALQKLKKTVLFDV